MARSSTGRAVSVAVEPGSSASALIRLMSTISNAAPDGTSIGRGSTTPTFQRACPPAVRTHGLYLASASATVSGVSAGLATLLNSGVRIWATPRMVAPGPMTAVSRSRPVFSRLRSSPLG